jgi:phage shock protein C
MNTTPQRMMRSRQDKMVAGVCGGLAQYFAIDPLIPRLIFAFLTLAFLPIGPVVYLVFWLVMPLEHEYTYQQAQQPGQPPVDPTQSTLPPAGSHKQRDVKLGTILLTVGISLLLSKIFPWIFPYIVPMLLIGAGIVIFYRTR